MNHPDEIQHVLRRARLSPAAKLDDDQLQRAELAAESIPTLKDIPLANFILKGGAGSGTSAGSGAMSMYEAAVTVLGADGGALHAKEIYERARRARLISPTGGTPEKTMATRLATGARKGEFERTRPNTFVLPDRKTAGRRAFGRRDPKRPVPAAA